MDASLFYMDLLELGIIMHRSGWQTGVTGHMSNRAHIWHLFVKCQKIKHLHYGGGAQKNKLTRWGSHILTSILMSHMMITKNPQNVHRKYFWAILLTFIFDVKIDINMCEPHYVNLLFFLWTSSIVCMFDFLIFDIFLTTWHLFDILTHQLNLNHLSPHRAIFVVSIVVEAQLEFVCDNVISSPFDLRSNQETKEKTLFSSSRLL